MNSLRTRLVLGMTALAVVVRIAPYLADRAGLLPLADFSGSLLSVAPVSAMFLFGGARLKNRGLGLLAPLAALVISDVLIGAIMADPLFYTLDPTRGAVVFGMILIAGLGGTLSEEASPLRIAGTAVVGEVLFYLVTNFAFWIFTDWYPHTAAGLVTNYTLALPFLGRQLLGMAVWGTALFGGLAWAERGVRHSARQWS